VPLLRRQAVDGLPDFCGPELGWHGTLKTPQYISAGWLILAPKGICAFVVENLNCYSFPAFWIP